MAEEADVTADAASIPDQIMAEHLGRARGHREQAGAGAQQARLPGAVGSLEQHDLSPRHVEIDAGEDREHPDQGDSSVEADGRGHVDADNAIGTRRHCSIQARRSDVRRAAAGRPGPTG